MSILCHAAHVDTSGHQHVSPHSPWGTPRVAKNPESSAASGISVADQVDCVIDSHVHACWVVIDPWTKIQTNECQIFKKYSKNIQKIFKKKFKKYSKIFKNIQKIFKNIQKIFKKKIQKMLKKLFKKKLKKYSKIFKKYLKNIQKIFKKLTSTTGSCCWRRWRRRRVHCWQWLGRWPPRSGLRNPSRWFGPLLAMH